jgi:hypothetical protein
MEAHVINPQINHRFLLVFWGFLDILKGKYIKVERGIFSPDFHVFPLPEMSFWDSEKSEKLIL